VRRLKAVLAVTVKPGFNEEVRTGRSVRLITVVVNAFAT
jgi:hypothetical protein